jgi:hypothetical protein
MAKQATYAAELARTHDKPAFLRRHSGLPGPRGNLELVQAAADVGGEADFREWIALGSPGAPSVVDPTDEFLAVCGVVGLGRLVAEGCVELAGELRVHAEDRRWRVREGVAMALQRVGDADVGLMFMLVSGWLDGRSYLQRAVVAGIAEPRLLKTADAAAQAVAIVDHVTALFAASGNRRTDESRTLRQALGYCWSVVAAADPPRGRARLEHWVASPDPDIRWIVRENLKKARLARLDPEWTAAMNARLAERRGACPAGSPRSRSGRA